MIAQRLPGDGAVEGPQRVVNGVVAPASKLFRIGETTQKAAHLGLVGH